MSTEASNFRNMTFRNTVKIGDLSIVLWIVNFSSLFKPNGYHKKSGLQHAGTLLGQWFRFDRAILASAHWSMWSIKPGSQTMGILSVAFVSLSIVGLNHSEIPIYLKPFSIIVVPIAMMRTDSFEWTFYWKYDYESAFLLWYSVVFTLISLVHLVMIWLDKGNQSMTKRGQSWLVLLLSKYMTVNEFFICGIVQPVICMLLGIFLLNQYDDTYACIFLCVTSLAEASQQMVDNCLLYTSPSPRDA